jgi:hypothetical protein
MTKSDMENDPQSGPIQVIVQISQAKLHGGNSQNARGKLTKCTGRVARVLWPKAGTSSTVNNIQSDSVNGTRPKTTEPSSAEGFTEHTDRNIQMTQALWNTAFHKDDQIRATINKHCKD